MFYLNQTVTLLLAIVWCTSGAAQNGISEHNTWMHGGHALKAYVFALPPVLDGATHYTGGLAYQRSFSREWAFDINANYYGNSSAAGEGAWFYSGIGEIRRYQCLHRKEGRKFHGFVSGYMAFMRSRRYYPGLTGEIRYHHWAALVPGASAGLDIHFLKKLNVEFLLGLGLGMDMIADNENPKTHVLSQAELVRRSAIIPRARIQLVIPLKRKP